MARKVPWGFLDTIVRHGEFLQSLRVVFPPYHGPRMVKVGEGG